MSIGLRDAGLLVMAATLAAALARDPPTAIAYAALFGLNNAVGMTFFAFLWPRYFGRLHLGSIQGTGQKIGVVGASLGPAAARPGRGRGAVPAVAPLDGIRPPSLHQPRPGAVRARPRTRRRRFGGSSCPCCSMEDMAMTLSAVVFHPGPMGLHSLSRFLREPALDRYAEARGARLENGVLTIELVRELPEALRPRVVPIGGPRGRRERRGLLDRLRGALKGLLGRAWLRMPRHA